MAIEMGVDPKILKAVMTTNEQRRTKIISRLLEIVNDLNGKTIGVFGLSFKPNTDDMRDAPSIDIINNLLSHGAKVKAYDPVAMEEAAKHLPDIQLVSDPYEAADGVDALLVITEWNEFIHVDLERIHKHMNNPVVIDGRNIYEPEKMKRLGFKYRGIGRGYNQNDK